MVEGIVLAAGSSSRAGSFKMELPLGDKILIERSIEGMYDLCSRIIVVGGFRVERVRELLASYSKVEVVENKNWQSGMFGSVQCGVALVRAEKFFLLPADVALVPQVVFAKLNASRGDVLIPTYQGKKGHPILINTLVVPAILKEPSESSMRTILSRLEKTFVEVEKREILLDIDTEADYDLARRMIAGGMS